MTRETTTPPRTQDALRGYGFAIGRYTVGTPVVHRAGGAGGLVVGDYTSIADGVQLVLADDGAAAFVASYPLHRLQDAEDGAPAMQGAVRIGNDVTIEAGAIIRPGTTIGDGAHVRSGAVVRGEVPAYAIVAGNPGAVVGARFVPEVAARLVASAWWDWPEYKLRCAEPLLRSSDVGAFLAFSERAAPGPVRSDVGSRLVFDCIMYNGEADVLEIRLNELGPVVDRFVIVESDVTFSGLPRTPRFDPADPRFDAFRDRIRHIVVRDMPETSDPWVREIWQRNAILRGTHDAAPDDLIILSDADEIPRAWAVALMAADASGTTFGLAMRLSYFFLNYAIVGGADASQVWAVAGPRRVFDAHSPQELRMGVRLGQIGATVLQRAGWHFSYLFDEDGIRRKIGEFSHQEFNAESFLAQIDVARLVRGRGDLFGERGNVWDIVEPDDLPRYTLAHRARFSRHILPPGDALDDAAPPAASGASNDQEGEQMPVAISAVLIGQGRDDTMRLCLRGLLFADEIVVVDPPATGPALQAALRVADHVVQSGEGVSPLDAGLAACRHEWIVMVTDSLCPGPQAAAAIRAAIAGSGGKRYAIAVAGPGGAEAAMVAVFRRDAGPDGPCEAIPAESGAVLFRLQPSGDPADWVRGSRRSGTHEPDIGRYARERLDHWLAVAGQGGAAGAVLQAIGDMMAAMPARIASGATELEASLPPLPHSAEKRFTADWFSHNIPNWGGLLAAAGLRAGEALAALELGSYEGRAADWLLDNLLTHPDSRLDCVDTFPRREDPDSYWHRFRQNVLRRADADKVQAHATTTVSVLVDALSRKRRFDLIYVDASHRSLDVLSDLMLSFRLLKVGGLMICDDYLGGTPAGQDLVLGSPKFGIDLFTTVARDRLEIVSGQPLYQLAFIKRREFEMDDPSSRGEAVG